MKKQSDKLLLLSKISSRYFLTNRSLQILVASSKVAEFVDLSLWATPSHSFIPHGLGPPYLIQITETEGLSHKYILNLTEKPIQNSFNVIHEFEDGSPFSKEKYQVYKELGYNIIVI
jgi:DNA polymerase IIIc chi subunit